MDTNVSAVSRPLTHGKETSLRVEASGAWPPAYEDDDIECTPAQRPLATGDGGTLQEPATDLRGGEPGVLKRRKVSTSAPGILDSLPEDEALSEEEADRTDGHGGGATSAAEEGLQWGAAVEPEPAQEPLLSTRARVTINEEDFVVVVPRPSQVYDFQRVAQLVDCPPVIHPGLPQHVGAKAGERGATILNYASAWQRDQAGFLLQEAGMLPTGSFRDPAQAHDMGMDQAAETVVTIQLVPLGPTTVEAAKGALNAMGLRCKTIKERGLLESVSRAMPGRPSKVFVSQVKVNDRPDEVVAIAGIVTEYALPDVPAGEGDYIAGSIRLRGGWRTRFGGVLMTNDGVANPVPFEALHRLANDTEGFLGGRGKSLFLFCEEQGGDCAKCWLHDDHSYAAPCQLAGCGNCVQPNHPHETRHCPRLPCLFCNRNPDKHGEGVDNCIFKNKCFNCLEEGHGSNKLNPCKSQKGFVSVMLELERESMPGSTERGRFFVAADLEVALREKYLQELEFARGGMTAWKDRATGNQLILCHFKKSFAATATQWVRTGWIPYSHHRHHEPIRVTAREPVKGGPKMRPLPEGPGPAARPFVPAPPPGVNAWVRPPGGALREPVQPIEGPRSGDHAPGGQPTMVERLEALTRDMRADREEIKKGAEQRAALFNTVHEQTILAHAQSTALKDLTKSTEANFGNLFQAMGVLTLQLNSLMTAVEGHFPHLKNINAFPATPASTGPAARKGVTLPAWGGGLQ